MSTPVNGHGTPQPDPATDVARAVWTANMDDGDLPWGELTEEERQHLTEWAQGYLAGHVAWLAENGFEIVPAGAVRRPKSEPEAMGMLQAAKDFFDGQKRKGKLMGQVPSAKKLILPPGVH